MFIRFQRSIFLLYAVIIFAGCKYDFKVPADNTSYQFRETTDLVNTVNDAAELFEVKGAAAFSEFDKKNSKWYKGNKYIFLYDLEGTCVYHASLKNLIGKNLLNLKDINEKPIIQMIMSIASNEKKPFGWIHYLWTEPGEIFPSWKSAYIMRVKGPDGKIYAIGSGTYSVRTEFVFVKDIVDSAANLIQKEGKNAYPILQNKSDMFYFNDTYVFVMTMHGDMLVDPSFPTNIGRNVMGFMDGAGHPIVKDLLSRIQDRNTVTLTYLKPSAPQMNPIKKQMYVRKIISGSDTLLVGSAMIVTESIWKRF